MKSTYSSSSVALDRFAACYGALASSIQSKSVSVRGQRIDESQSSKITAVLQKLEESDFPITFIFENPPTSVQVKFNFVWTVFSVEVDGLSEDEAQRINALIRDSLQLAEVTEKDTRGIASLPHINDVLWRVYDVVNELSAKIVSDRSTQPTQSLRCFVSFRFDEHSKALAFELREFLELVNVEFVSGLGYEPRSISEKVLERLSNPLDLFVIVQTTTGDSSWLNQEIGVARGRGLPVLVLREEGAVADLGILGDTEYLPFPENNISRAFVGILQALSYLKEQPNGNKT